MAEVRAVQGDITRLEVDAIVNAANNALRQGSGVCGAIFAAAGASELRAACAEIGHCDTGDAVATPGFRLPARWVIHTVGPVWQGGARDEEALLASCYRRCLEVADSVGARTIAFPAISTGVFGFPPDRAAEIAVETVRATRAAADAVLLVAFDDATYHRYVELLG